MCPRAGSRHRRHAAQLGGGQETTTAATGERPLHASAGPVNPGPRDQAGEP
jgi:hypothetical protein